MSIDYYQEKRLEIIRKRKLEREVEASKTDATSNELNKIDPTDNHQTERLDHKRKHRTLESLMKNDSDILKKKKEKELADEYWNERQKTLKSTKVTHVSADDYLKQFLASRSSSTSSKKQDSECKTSRSTLDMLHTPGKWNTTTTSNHDQNRVSVTGSTFMTMSSPSILSNNNHTHAHPFIPSTSKEDPLAKQLAFLARRKKERLAAAGSASNSTLAPTPSKDTYIEKGNCEQNHNKDSNTRESNHDSSNSKHSSDEEEDLNICLYEYSKRQRRKAKLEKHKRDSYTSDSSSQSSQDDNHAGKSSHGLQSLSSNVRDDMNYESLSKSMVSKVKQVRNDASLWSDSDQSDMESANATKANMHDGSNNGATRRGTKRRQAKTPTSQVESDEEEPFDSDETLLQDLKPNFENPTFEVGELEPFVLDRLVYDNDELGQENEEEVQTHQIPASIARYIQPYQKEGIEFMYQSVIRRKGCILGHDMGLGKTVQLIALLSALQEKTGTKLDLKHITERHKAIVNEEVKSTEQSRKALLYGGSIAISESKPSASCNQSKTFGPVLIIVPSSVLKNWNNEFQTWGHFAVSTYYGADKSNALNRIKTGFDDILLCGKPTIQSERGIEELLLIPWELVVVDEFHDYKSHTSQSYKSLFEIRNRYNCPILGMTGTLMSNNHKELWTLVDLVRPGHLDSWTVFRREYERPIQLSRVKGARPDAIRLGKERSKELHDALRDVYQKREKSIVLEDFLPTKHQVVMFCTPTDIQKRIYQHILQLPEYELLRKSNAPCDCGVNQAFFTNYASLTNRKQRDEYYRRFKKKIVPRKQCCYKIPKGKDLVLWPAQHPDGEACKFCPSCILFPAMTKLDKLCSHAALLQIPQHPDSVGDESRKEIIQKDLDFAKVALPHDVLQYFGNSYIRDSSIMGQHLILSGKLRTLKGLLNKFQYQKDKVLVFSYSTDTLDLIESQVKLSGFTYLRLDGKTQTSSRQMLVDKFQNDEKITLFLISTKAGGMGLNLTAANRVIIYDVNWSPSHDEQAQDRAFRIGQNRDVEVIRLIAQGTIEELRYARQLYKTHLKQESLESSDYATAETIRMFRGVQGDSSRKGELFGLENLLKFKDGSFTKGKGMWKTSSKDPSLCTLALERNDAKDHFNRGGDTEEMEDFMEAFNHDQFLREDGYGNQQHLNHEDEELGGESQMAHEVLGGSLENATRPDAAPQLLGNTDYGLSAQSAETDILISAVKSTIPSADEMGLSDSSCCSNSSTHSQEKVHSDGMDKRKCNVVLEEERKVQEKKTSIWGTEQKRKGPVKRKPINLFIRKQDKKDS